MEGKRLMGYKREFREGFKDDLVEYAGKGIGMGDRFYGQIIDWINEYSSLASSGLNRNADSYYGELNQTLLNSKQNIVTLFDAAASVEADYAQKFADITLAMSRYTDKICELRNMLISPALLNTAADPFANPDLEVKLNALRIKILTAEISDLIAHPEKLAQFDIENCDPQLYIDFINNKYRGQDMFNPSSATPNISDIERDLLIKCYEYMHPENAEKMNIFLQPIIQDGNYDTETKNIKYLAYAAPDTYNSVLFKYLPEVNIKEYHQSGSQYFYHTRSGFLGFGPGNNNLYIDIDRVLYNDPINDPTNSNDPGGYTVFFHELGHAIDYVMGKAGYANSTSLDDTIKKDVENNLKLNIIILEPSLNATQTQLIADSLMKGQTITGDSVLDNTRADVQTYYEKLLAGGSQYCTSDTYSGVTGNNVQGSYAHVLDRKGKPYWDSHLPSVEFFASAFSHNITGYADSIKAMGDYLKNSTIEFTVLIETASK